MLPYLAVAYGWTWSFWLGGLLVARVNEVQLNVGATLFDLFTMFTGAGLMAQALFAVGVFGPALAYLFMRRYRPFFGRPVGWPLLVAIMVPVLSLAPALILSMVFVPPSSGLRAQTFLVTVFVYALSNLLTSGTEEFGWRGYLYPTLKQSERSFWSNAWKGGLFWAIWHLPLLAIIYWSLGFAMLPTLAGFTASIIAMNYITNVVYERSDSIFLAMLLHSLNNTGTFALVLAFPTTPFTLVVAAMAWVFVGILEKKLRIDQVKAR